MATRQSNTDRVRLFSDGVFAVLITILVLELKPPHADTFSALLPLWPTGLSYAVNGMAVQAADFAARRVLSNGTATQP